MKSEKGFSLIEVIISLTLILGSITLLLSNIMITRRHLIKSISEKALLIEYHHIMEIFYQDYNRFESIIKQYNNYEDGKIKVKPYKLNKIYYISFFYKVTREVDYVIYSLEVIFPYEISSNNQKYFNNKSSEIIVYE